MTELIQNKGRISTNCSACGKELNPKIGDYKKCVKEDGSYYCSQCAKNHFQKFVSFYEWCYSNLLEEEANNILDRCPGDNEHCRLPYESSRLLGCTQMAVD
jgi:hypothetical protein